MKNTEGNTLVSNRNIAVIGAGFTGSLLAIYLAKRGLEVDVYERKPDMREHDLGGGHSIYHALSTRGIHVKRRRFV